MLKKLTAAAIAASMVMAPTVAAAQSVQREVAPSTETVEEGNEIRGGFILPLAAIVAIVLAVILLTDDDEDPDSP